MQWSTFTNSQEGSLTFNGPYLIQITGGSIATIQRPQVVQLIKPIVVGTIIIYGTAVAGNFPMRGRCNDHNALTTGSPTA